MPPRGHAAAGSHNHARTVSFLAWDVGCSNGATRLRDVVDLTQVPSAYSRRSQVSITRERISLPCGKAGLVPAYGNVLAHSDSASNSINSASSTLSTQEIQAFRAFGTFGYAIPPAAAASAASARTNKKILL